VSETVRLQLMKSVVTYLVLLLYCIRSFIYISVTSCIIRQRQKLLISLL